MQGLYLYNLAGQCITDTIKQMSVMVILWTLPHAGRLPTMTLRSLSYVPPTRSDLAETGKQVFRVTKNAYVDGATFHPT